MSLTFTYVLKKPNLKQNLEQYVSGANRLNFIKRPVIEEEDDSTPVM